MYRGRIRGPAEASDRLDAEDADEGAELRELVVDEVRLLLRFRGGRLLRKPANLEVLEANGDCFFPKED